MSTTVARPPRNGALDLIKIICTVFIVFHHYQGMTGITLPLVQFYNGSFYFGYLVELFFMISGFLAASNLREADKRAPFRAYLHKFLRIWPVAVISILIFIVLEFVCYGLNGQFWAYYGLGPLPFNFVQGFLSLFFVGINSGIIPVINMCPNQQVWYLQVLLLCYLIFHLSHALGRRCKSEPLSQLLMLGMVLIGITAMNRGEGLTFVNANTARGLVTFFLGALIAWALRYLPRKTCKWVSLACLVFTCGMIAADHSILTSDPWRMVSFVLYPSLVVFAATSDLAAKLLNRKPIYLLSQVSFSVYIWHECLFFIQFMVIGALHLSVVYSGWSMLGFTLVAEAVGFLSYFALEKPLARKTKTLEARVAKRLDQETAQTPQAPEKTTTITG